jgi:sodium-dependent dicarboxylate transporter 2/3/5
MLAVTALMATWWITEPIPLAATSLLPLVLFPLLGIASAAKAAAPYANHLIYLFMGGFMLAQAMLRWSLHRRLALRIVTVVGTSPSRIVLGLMVASAFVSMWVSNTATAAMMMPLGLALTQQVSEAARARKIDLDLTPGRFHFGVDVMLGIAYSASIGGVGTLIGTPPNVLLAGTLEKSFGVHVTFLQWLLFGVPFVIVFVPLVWLYLTRLAYPIELDELPGGPELIAEQLRELGPMSQAERRLSMLLAVTAAAWIFLPLWTSLLPFGSLVTDSTIAIAAALLAFLLPAGRGERLLDWPSASRLPWDVLVLFGGGFSLAEGFETSGLAAWVGGQLALFSGVPLPLFVATIVSLTILLTEFASNTASAAMVIPVVGAIAVGMGDSPLLLCVPAAVAASCAFMLPAATPPNAIVFGTGYITIPQMVKAGVWVGLIAVVLVSVLTLLLLGPVFGG